MLAGYGEEEGCDIIDAKFACSYPSGPRFHNREHWCFNCNLAYLAGAKIAEPTFFETLKELNVILDDANTKSEDATA